MFTGIRLGVPALLGGSFSPATLFAAAGSRGFFYDLSDYGTQFTDTTGTTGVTGVGQSLARVNDKSGLGNHATQAAAGSRALTQVRPMGVERRNRAIGSGDVGNAAIWQTSVLQNGITMTKVASGTDTDGLPYVDVRYQGTATSTVHDQICPFGAFVLAGSPGQQATCSVIARVIGGSTTNVTGFWARVSEETAPSTFIGIALGTAVTSTTDTLTTATRTITTGNQWRATLALNFTNGATIDITYRIKGLMFELGSTRTAYQRVITANEWYEPGFTSYRGIFFDGVDDFLQTAAIDFSNSDKVTVVAGVRKLSDAAQAELLGLTTSPPTGSGTFWLQTPNAAAAANYVWNSRGTATSSTSASPFAAPDTAVITGIGDISGDSAIIRRNGVQVSTNATDQGTGNYANDIVYIGRRGGATLPFNGVLTFLCVINRTLTAGELAQLEAFANSRTGAF